MERARCTVDEARDAVLHSLGRVLVLARLFEPLWMLLCLTELEAHFAQQLGWVELAVLRAQHVRPRVDPSQQSLDRPHLFLAHQIELIEDQHVGKLKLVEQEVREQVLAQLADGC